MVIQPVTRYNPEEIRAITADKRVVILYPQLPFRNLLLASLLKEGVHITFYCPSEGVIPLGNWVSGLADELMISDRRQVDALIASGSWEAAGQAVARLLNSRSDRQLLVLDELDRLNWQPPAAAFFSGLAAGLNAHVQLVVSARAMRLDPWLDLIRSGQAVVLGNRDRSTDLLFTVTTPPRLQLEIYGFGAGRALINGYEVNGWEGVLPRNLFFYFMDQNTLTRDQVFGIFWPSLGQREAANVYHVTKRKITECLALGIPDDPEPDWVAFLNGVYRISDQVIRHYDVADFEHYANLAAQTADDAQREALYERAAALYRGPFLETVNMPWVVVRREKLRRLYVDVLVQLGRMQQASGRNFEALGSFVNAIRENPHREDLHRSVIHLYVQMGRVDDARRQYLNLRDLLRATLRMDPSPETRALYESLENTR